MTVTLHDVAREAGVSKSTVSNVIRDAAPVSDRTRERVEAAIAALGYQPDVIARALKQRATRTLGLIVPEATNPFFANLGLGAERAAHEQGYALLIANTECSPEMEDEVARALIGRRVDGVILGGTCEGSRVHEDLLAHGVPTVAAGFVVDDPRIDVLDADDEAAMDGVVEHLAALGHRRLAFVRHHLREAAVERRAEGFERAVRQRGLALVGLDERPTAIACHNDTLAIETIDRLERAGLRVPDDVSVVGFDDVPLAAHVRIGLTTVRWDGQELGRQATSLVLGAVGAARHATERRTLPTELVIRRTTGPSPA